MSPFATFSLPPSLLVDEDQLQNLYRDLAAQHHPDKGGERSTFDQINRAYQTLKSPSKRLQAYMEATNIEFDSRGAVSNHLMDLFMQVGSLLQNTDAFIRKKSSANSALAKALLEPESMHLQDQLTLLIHSVESSLNTLTETLSESPPPETLPQTFRDLSFLEKWHAQLQQRYGALF
ncbi:J domain-containing protein [Rubritalea tangerina]|uniref:DnaJ family molecular chaperone n=1 Tax=Rubritalea tangerina TaxID=430798 RepID=A0ABW4Z9S7_9BACT